MAGLFQGDPQTATSYTTSSTETPKWMQDAIYNQIQWATNLANTPYQSYDLPTVAGLSPLQQQAYSNVEANQGAWAPQLGQAAQGTQSLASAPGGQAAAQPYYNQQSGALGSINYQQPTQSLSPYVQQAMQTSGINAAQPYLGNEAQTLGSLNFGQAGQTLNPFIQQALGTSGVQAASPYLQGAGQSSVSDISSYMNPYTQNVTDQIAKLGARNLSENLLPNVSDAFIKAGSFGGTRMGEFGERALRDTQESILNQQAQALQSGYGQALTTSAADKARLAGLGSTMGNLTQAQQQAIMSGGQALSGAQQQALQQQLAAAGQYGTMAGQIGNLTQAQQQALLSGGQALSGAQQQAIQSQLSGAGQYGQMAAGLGSLAGADQARQQSALAQLAQMAQQGQTMSAADTAALEAAGKAQQGQTQADLNAAYQQWQQEQLYPKQQMDWLSTQVRGMAPITPTSTTQSGTTTGATYSASPLSQLATGLAAGAGLYNTIK